MEWTPYNNTTPWGLLSSDQKDAIKKAYEKVETMFVGKDGLDYYDRLSWSEARKEGMNIIRPLYKFGRNNYPGHDWVEYSPYRGFINVDKFNVLRVSQPRPKAPPPPEPREFYIVMDHGKLIGYFNDYPVALQHYEIIKVKEQL